MDEIENELPFDPLEEGVGDGESLTEESDFDLNEEGEMVGGGPLEEEEEKDY